MTVESLDGLRLPESQRRRRTRPPVAMFAKAIGETDPVYRDVDAARGRRPSGSARTRRRSCSVSTWSIRHVSGSSRRTAWTSTTSCTASSVHATTGPVHAGDRLSPSRRIHRRLLETQAAPWTFLVRRTHVTSRDDLVAEMDSVSVIRMERHREHRYQPTSRSEPSCRPWSWPRSPAPRWPCSPVRPATTTRSTSTSTSPRPPVSTTSSPTACCRWRTLGRLVTAWVPQSRSARCPPGSPRSRPCSPRRRAPAASS